MNLKPIIICLVVVLTLSLFSCSADPERLIIVADVDNSIGNQEIEIIAGGSLVIHLDSNPTTGFSWRLAGISHQNVVIQDGQPQYIAHKESIMGAGGREIWTFRTLAEGTAVIFMEYSRPLANGFKLGKQYYLTVIVK